jgi:hypothetical protein
MRPARAPAACCAPPRWSSRGTCSSDTSRAALTTPLARRPGCAARMVLPPFTPGARSACATPLCWPLASCWTRWRQSSYAVRAAVLRQRRVPHSALHARKGKHFISFAHTFGASRPCAGCLAAAAGAALRRACASRQRRHSER